MSKRYILSEQDTKYPMYGQSDPREYRSIVGVYNTIQECASAFVDDYTKEWANIYDTVNNEYICWFYKGKKISFGVLDRGWYDMESKRIHLPDFKPL